MAARKYLVGFNRCNRAARRKRKVASDQIDSHHVAWLELSVRGRRWCGAAGHHGHAPGSELLAKASDRRGVQTRSDQGSLNGNQKLTSGAGSCWLDEAGWHSDVR